MKYRKQKYFSCQLIAAINARIFLGKEDIDDDLFEILVDYTKCRNGGALHVKKAYPILELYYKDGPLNPSWIKKNLPIQLAIRDPKLGCHDVLVDKASDDELRLVNFSGPNDVITWKHLSTILPAWDQHRICRSFRLKNYEN